MNKSQLHIASGCVVVIDPMFVDYAKNPLSGDGPALLENDLFLNSTGFDKLLALEAIAMGRDKLREELRTIGYYDLRPREAGPCSFTIHDIRRAEFDAEGYDTKVFSVDSGQVLVFDAEYLDGVLQHFDWKT